MIKSLCLLILLAFPLFGADKVITIQDNKVGIGVGEAVPTHKLQVKGGDVLIEDNLTVNQNVDLNGGAIDGTVIGGTTPADGSFDTLSFSILGTQLNANMFILNEGFLILGDAQNIGSVVSLDSILNTNGGKLTVRGVGIDYSHISGSVPLPGDVVQTGEDATLGALTVDSLSFNSAGSLNNVAIVGADSSFSGKSLTLIDSVDSVIDFPDGKLESSDVALAQGQIMIGDTNGIARPQPVRNDLTVDPLGNFTIAESAVTSAKIDNDTILSEDIFDHTITGDDLAPGLLGIDIDGGNIDGVEIGSVTPAEATFGNTHVISNLGVGQPANAGYPSTWGTIETGRIHADDLFLTNQLGVGSTGSKARFYVNEWGKITAKKMDLTNSAEETYYKLDNAVIGSRKDSIIDLRSLDGYATIDFSGTFDTATDYQGRIGIEPGEDFITIKSENSSIGVDVGNKRIVGVGDAINADDAVNLSFLRDGTRNLDVGQISAVNDVIRVRNAANDQTMAEMRTDGEIWGRDLTIIDEFNNGATYYSMHSDGSTASIELKGKDQTYIDLGDNNTNYQGRLIVKTSESWLTINSGHSTIGLDLDGKRLYSIADPAHDTDAVNRRYVTNRSIHGDQITNNTIGNDQLENDITLNNLWIGVGIHMSGASSKINMNNKKIIELAMPTASADAANKSYVDLAVQDLNKIHFKNPIIFHEYFDSSTPIIYNSVTKFEGDPVKSAYSKSHPIYDKMSTFNYPSLSGWKCVLYLNFIGGGGHEAFRLDVNGVTHIKEQGQSTQVGMNFDPNYTYNNISTATGFPNSYLTLIVPLSRLPESVDVRYQNEGTGHNPVRVRRATFLLVPPGFDYIIEKYDDTSYRYVHTEISF